MFVATWNVNGIRARETQVLEWTLQNQPDVMCLQELKASPDQVPISVRSLVDYWSYWHGLGGYSGVSLHLHKKCFAELPVFSIPPFDFETRIVQAETPNVVFASVYVPNGGKDYAAKLLFLEHLSRYVQEIHQKGKALILAGDINITRTEQDVHSSQRDESVIGQRPDERAWLEAILAHGLVDVGRVKNPDDDRLFSWWPYWKVARLRNLGWRIDYILASQTIAEKCLASSIARDFGTSDHAPVLATFDVSTFL